MCLLSVVCRASQHCPCVCSTRRRPTTIATTGAFLLPACRLPSIVRIDSVLWLLFVRAAGCWIRTWTASAQSSGAPSPAANTPWNVSPRTCSKKQKPDLGVGVPSRTFRPLACLCAPLRCTSDTVGGAKEVTCRCGNVFCFQCRVPPHSPAPCDLVRKWREKAGEGDSADKATEVRFAISACAAYPCVLCHPRPSPPISCLCPDPVNACCWCVGADAAGCAVQEVPQLRRAHYQRCTSILL